MDEVSNFCTGDICQLRSDAAAAPQDVPSVAQLRDDPPWVCGGSLCNSTHSAAAAHQAACWAASQQPKASSL